MYNHIIIPDTQTAIATTKSLFTALREHPAQDTTSLLDNLRSQHAHLVTTGNIDVDPNIDHP